MKTEMIKHWIIGLVVVLATAALTVIAFDLAYHVYFQAH